MKEKSSKSGSQKSGVKPQGKGQKPTQTTRNSGSGARQNKKSQISQKAAEENYLAANSRELTQM